MSFLGEFSKKWFWRGAFLGELLKMGFENRIIKMNISRRAFGEELLRNGFLKMSFEDEIIKMSFSRRAFVEEPLNS